jgi:hypothetical protein
MAEKLANVPGAQNEVPPSSAIETAGTVAQATTTTAAAAGSRDRNVRARHFGSRAIVGPLFHADRQSPKLRHP